jgi:L,D-transpeptidase YcbB
VGESETKRFGRVGGTMHGGSFLAVNVVGGLALVLTVLVPVAGAAEDVTTAEQPAAPTSSATNLPDKTTSSSTPAPTTGLTGASAPGRAAPSPSPQNTTAPAAPAVDPAVAAIRTKLANASLRKGAAAADLAALGAFYAERSGPPVWTTGMGFSAKAQAVINEIGKADDWGLSAAAFELPLAGDLPATADAQAVAEIKLQLAVLKYARFARGGRADPSSLSELIDQAPTLLEPKVVLTEIAASPAPDAYLQSLHPKHEQFQRLRQALLKARGVGNGDAAKKPRNEQEIQRLLINMERWRWMPSELGTVYVQDNVPEFTLYVVKNGKTIHSDKIVVGQRAYATPIFSADMRSIVFNPEWTVPPTVVRENLLPNLRSGGWFGGSTSILREHGLQVKYNGRTVDPGSINWNSVNMANIAFTQPPGPDNALGKLKFIYPNKHLVYMHDTSKRQVFKETMRAIGHNCIRMANPSQLAEILLEHDKGWDSKKIEDLLAKGVNEEVALDHPVPVHTTYFTAVVDDQFNVTSFADVYGLDPRVAPIVLGKAVAYAPSADDAGTGDAAEAESTAKPKAKKQNVAGSIQGLFGD